MQIVNIKNFHIFIKWKQSLMEKENWKKKKQPKK